MPNEPSNALANPHHTSCPILADTLEHREEPQVLPTANVLQIGSYLVGEAHDPKLCGHPYIRY
ncbi:hypothetical protein D3Y59_14395 [Hymenobacter oligotrophus]|uniref:Uncharacterized protein n=1 Tax=Hymenobacter oligotrophus TaxID=2319843 RepID=A0A3B7R402_9BACT|nr:hypothetical protein D3Y59_14395 [Hymenobacter oligotrophus]